MSRGRARTRLFATMAVASALMVYGLVVAVPASAAASCTFSSGAVNIALPLNGDTANVQQNPAGQILYDGVTPCAAGAALVSNTTSITISGGADNQHVNLWLSDTAGDKVGWGTIKWTISLGSETAATAGDTLLVYNADTAVTAAVDIAMGANGIDLNNDGTLDVTVSGIDNYSVQSDSLGDDTISAAGSTATGAAFPQGIKGILGILGDGDPGLYAADSTATGNNYLAGGAGDDETLMGAVVGWDIVAGGLGNDYLDGNEVDYSGSATAVNVNLPGNTATGEGVDTLTANITDVDGSGLADVLTGRDGEDNYFYPGAGDDKVNGGAAMNDTVDYYDAEAAVEVDLTAQTATGGSGNDTLTSIESAAGSGFNDTLTGSTGLNTLYGRDGNDSLAGWGGNDTLRGGNGIDTADYSWSTDAVTLKLNCGGDAPANYGSGSTSAPTLDVIRTMENGLLTAKDDSFTGNEFANKVWPNGGQNSLAGDCTTVNTGGDVLDYSQGYEAGVSVNMAGGATAGDSAVGFENATGTKFADTFVGNEVSNTINGAAGGDSLKGGSGDDTLKGGKGNDALRGGSGDDDLFGGKGKKDQAWGGNGTDLCKGAEVKNSCEIK